jgi:uncharacterized membrane protein
MPQGVKQAMASAVAGELASHPQALREQIQHDDSGDMQRRRAIVAASLGGIASMVPVILYQTGIIKHLPDPPVGNFHSDKVNGSETAFGYGGPDGPMSVLTHTLSMALAAFGGADRAEQRPWVPLAASALAGAQAGVAAVYLTYQMPKVDKAWCPYCITDAFMHMGTFALTLPEAKRALDSLRRH